MEINVINNNVANVIEVSGMIDRYNSSKLYISVMTLLRHDNKSVILNIKENSYLDSTGLGVIIRAGKMLEEKKLHLIIVAENRLIINIFQLTRLTLSMSLTDTMENAEKEIHDGYNRKNIIKTTL